MTRYSVTNRIVGVLLFPFLLIIVGVWQLGGILSRVRAWILRELF